MEFDVTIEIPKGTRNKYEMEPQTGRLSRADAPVSVRAGILRRPDPAVTTSDLRRLK